MKKFVLLLWLLVLATGVSTCQDLPAEIRRQLNAGDEAVLFYPKSVKRFYEQVGFNPAWIKPQNGAGPAWQAMLLLDCVLQYGLAHDDYHPKVLLYDQLHAILDTPGKVDISQQARFDILLTDAIITLVNNLHFGKLNPEFPAAGIDAGNMNSFRAEATLQLALQQKKGYSFLATVESVQPKSKAYQDLQHRMRLVTGLYTGDCYEVPERDIRIMAINLERLRWANMVDSSYIQVNIPAYTLQFVRPDTTYTFRVAVGKAGSPTPAFNSAISYLTTAPDVVLLQDVFRNTILPNALKDSNYLRDNHIAIYDKKGKFIVVDKMTLADIAEHPGDYRARHGSGCDLGQGDLAFHLSNSSKTDLHDMPKTDFFNQNDRAITTGCIWVDDAEKLATLMLKHDGRENEAAILRKAMSSYKRKTFILQKQVPLKVTYLTCAVKNGELIFHKDIYNLDKSLEMALYNVKQNLVMR
ncbi:L,D-transpeptidase family protein [Mucilaginibacter sp. UR6-11]|uniref:L,D-transpeptidase family protein n=1 Tax=Mucilaginibacter sp. UR6-11 TaxID=1435644 RepID=UPI001E5D8B76|nr:L,D-transpeptidase family protein [Mucilaginibacter sp. UR6-11]MCC8425499.1 L,D-transpeptidase family protein [Mucilaginibacter sp. UR6-11]